MNDFDVLKLSKLGVVEPYIYDEVVKEELLDIPNLTSMDEAIEIYKKHHDLDSPTMIHCDVDQDGVSCGYEIKRYRAVSGRANNTYLVINKERKHGIDEQKVNRLNTANAGLMIIVDSSSNELELIKQFTCDVIVLDHHEISLTREQLTGYTNSGHRYAIVTNMLSNDTHMSGGMVVYGFLREFNKRHKLISNFSDLMLEQWVALTLYSDVIPCLNERNQYFLSKLLDAKVIEPSIKMMMNSLEIFTINKTAINFNLVPLVNSAIRAGHSLDVLNTVLTNPGEINKFQEIKENQKKMVEKSTKDKTGEQEFKSFVMKSLDGSEVSKAYAGLVASKIKDSYNKCAFVYTTSEDGVLSGSFRGLSSTYDYRAEFIEHGAKAMGHKGAFGLEIHKDKVPQLLEQVCDINEKNKYFLTMGDEDNGIGHIGDMKWFKSSTNLFNLAVCNSRCTGNEELNIIYTGYVGEPEICGKAYRYNIDGLECTAFKPITTRKSVIYVEKSNELKAYIKELKE